MCISYASHPLISTAFLGDYSVVVCISVIADRIHLDTNLHCTMTGPLCSSTRCTHARTHTHTHTPLGGGEWCSWRLKAVFVFPACIDAGQGEDTCGEISLQVESYIHPGSQELEVAVQGRCDSWFEWVWPH